MSNPMQTHGAPSWLAHSSADPLAARAFYEKVLGWKVVDMPMKSGGTYPGIMIEDAPVGGFNPTPVTKGEWTAYITVDNVDDRYAAALDAGAESLSEPSTMPGVGRMATIRDPNGASIAFITYESQM